MPSARNPPHCPFACSHPGSAGRHYSRGDFPAVAIGGSGGAVPGLWRRPSSSPAPQQHGRSPTPASWSGGASRSQSHPQRLSGNRGWRPDLRRRHPAQEHRRIPVPRKGPGRPRTSGLRPGPGRCGGSRRSLDIVRGGGPRPDATQTSQDRALRGRGVHTFAGVLHDGHRDGQGLARRHHHRRRGHHRAVRRAVPDRAGVHSPAGLDRPHSHRPDRTLLKLQRPRGRHQLAGTPPRGGLDVGGRHHHAGSPFRRSSRVPGARERRTSPSKPCAGSRPWPASPSSWCSPPASSTPPSA